MMSRTMKTIEGVDFVDVGIQVRDQQSEVEMHLELHDLRDFKENAELTINHLEEDKAQFRDMLEKSRENGQGASGRAGLRSRVSWMTCERRSSAARILQGTQPCRRFARAAANS